MSILEELMNALARKGTKEGPAKRGTRVCPIRVIMKDSVQWEVKDLSVPAPVAGKVNDVKSPTNAARILVIMVGPVRSCCLITNAHVRMDIMENTVKRKRQAVLIALALMMEDALKQHPEVTNVYANQAFLDQHAQEPEISVYKIHVRMLGHASSLLVAKGTLADVQLDSKE